MLKNFKVVVATELGYGIWLKAEDEDQAECIAENLLDYGELPDPASHRDVYHREGWVNEVEEVEGIPCWVDPPEPFKVYSDHDLPPDDEVNMDLASEWLDEQMDHGNEPSEKWLGVLRSAYDQATEEQRRMMNMVLVAVTGWELNSILEQGREVGHDNKL